MKDGLTSEFVADQRSKKQEPPAPPTAQRAVYSSLRNVLFPLGFLIKEIIRIRLPGPINNLVHYTSSLLLLLLLLLSVSLSL